MHHVDKSDAEPRLTAELLVVAKAKPVFDSILLNRKSVFVPNGWGGWNGETIQNRLSVALRWLCRNRWPDDQISQLGKSLYNNKDYISLRGQVKIRLAKDGSGVKVCLMSAVVIERQEPVKFIELEDGEDERFKPNILDKDEEEQHKPELEIIELVIPPTPEVISIIEKADETGQEKKEVVGVDRVATIVAKQIKRIEAHFNNTVEEICMLTFIDIPHRGEKELEEILGKLVEYLDVNGYTSVVDRTLKHLRCLK